MATQYKDYYKTLGTPRTATADELKKSFRKLAREFHPDVAKDKKRAEEKFKDINEAYEVLSDPAKRKKYDELGADWKSGAEFRPPPGRGGFGGGPNPRGRGMSSEDFETQFGGTGFSDFFEQMFGSRTRGGAEGFGRRGNLAERGRAVEGGSRRGDFRADAGWPREVKNLARHAGRTEAPRARTRPATTRRHAEL